MLTINSKVLGGMMVATKEMTTNSLQAFLETVLLEAKDDVLSAKATDTVASVVVEEPCSVKEPFAACVQPKLLLAVIDGKDEDVTLSYKDNKLVATCGSVSAKLATIRAQDYLYPPSPASLTVPFDGRGIKSILQFCATDETWKSSVSLFGSYAYATDGLTVVRSELPAPVKESMSIGSSLMKKASFCLVPNARFGYDANRFYMGVGGAKVALLRDATANGDKVAKMFDVPTTADISLPRPELGVALNSLSHISAEESKCTFIVSGTSVEVKGESLLADLTHHLTAQSGSGVSQFSVSALRLQKVVTFLKENIITFRFTKNYVIINDNVIMSLLGGWS